MCGIDVGAMGERKQEGKIQIKGGIVSATAAAVSVLCSLCIVVRSMTGAELCCRYRKVKWHQLVVPAFGCSASD